IPKYNNYLSGSLPGRDARETLQKELLNCYTQLQPGQLRTSNLKVKRYDKCKSSDNESRPRSAENVCCDRRSQHFCSSSCRRLPYPVRRESANAAAGTTGW